MNILWLNHEYPPIGGGGATVCRALAREFAAVGHGVTVVTAGYELGVRKSEQSSLWELGVEIIRLKCRRKVKDQSTFFEMLSFLITAFRFVPKLIKKRRNGTDKIDAVYIFFGIPSGPLGWYFKKRFKIPYVICLGGGDIPGTQKRFAFAYVVLSPVIKAVWRNAACVVANSKMLLERATRFYTKARFTIIHNGVKLSDYDTRVIKPEDGIFRIITTARIVERKGIQHIIEALPQLIKATRGNIRYTVVGDGPYRKEIEALAGRLGVNDYLEITGMISFDEVIKKLQEADVFVLASHWEGMPNAVTEAMAARLPIIMSSCEGSAELVDGNGYIIEQGEETKNRLAEKLLLLYNDRQLTARLGQISYERVAEHFRWEKSAEQFLKLVEHAI